MTFLVAPGPARAEDPKPFVLPAKLTLAQALELFRQHGIDVLISEAAIAGAEGDLRAAGAVPNPTLGLSYGRSFYIGTCRDSSGAAVACGGLPGSYGASISDSAAIADTLSGKRGMREDVARAALEAARKGRDDAQRSLESQVKQQFVQVIIAQDTVLLARSLAQTWAQTAEKTDTKYKVGAISEADVARIDTARLEAEQIVDTALQNLQQARVGLAFLLGLRGNVTDFDAEEPGLLHYEMPKPLAGSTRDALLKQAFERRPDLKVAMLQQERAEASVRLAKRLRFPDIALSLTYAQQGATAPDSITPPSFVLGLSAPIPALYQQQGEIQRAEADLRTQVLLVTKTQSIVVSDVEGAYAGFVGADQLVRRMEGGLLERSKRARDLVLIQFQKGAATLLDYLDAQRTFTSTNLEYRQDLTAYWTSVFKLEQAVGAELR